jgi:myo-inositol-1(or 4)-monophosphatase
MKEFLKDIITEAGNLSLEYRKQLSTIEVSRKSDKDLVTNADRAIETFLRKEIGR